MATSRRRRIPLEQAVRRSEEDEPAHPQDLDAVGEPPQLGTLVGRTIDVAAIGLSEGDLVHQLDPAVADREQHDREHQADHHADQEPPNDDPHQDHEHDGVFERREQPPLVPDPLDDEGEPEEHQHASDDHPRDQPHDLRAEHDRGEGDERRIRPAALASTRMRCRERREAEGVITGDPPERPGHDVQDACVAELLVGVEVPIQDELAPGDVEQRRHRGHEDRGHDPGPRLEDGQPVGAPERAERPRLPEDRRNRTTRAAIRRRGPPRSRNR